MPIRVRAGLKRVFSAALIVLAVGIGASAQTPSTDDMSSLKNLPQDQQDALLQSVLGSKTNANGSKVDPRLSTPQTVLPKSDQLNGLNGEYAKDKTRDGRTLRMPNEDPELRPNDTVLIDLTPLETTKTVNGVTVTVSNNVMGNPPAAPGANAAGGVPGANGSAPTAQPGNVGALAAAGAAAGAAGAALASQAQNTPGGATGVGTVPIRVTTPNDFGRVQAELEPQTEEERQRAEDLRQRILQGNPYQLNALGVLELPGLPSIQLSGLTALEATNRLSADPELRNYTVRVTLLRLEPFGDQGVKPFGYDLFEGVPSTFAPVTDIQVPTDYVVGPGDQLTVQLYGNEQGLYTLTVGRDGRVNFPRMGPVRVGGLSFDKAREVIEAQVAQQLIGSRVSVTMGDLRSIRVFVLGDASKPGSYTVSGLSTMTNALFVSGGVKKTGSLRRIELRRNGELITVLDLYDLLLHGNTSGDKQLMPGDVIFIPPIGRTVSVYGAVRRPAIYELKNENDAEQVVDIAGGLLPDADGKLVQLERIEPSLLRQMVNVDLSTAVGRLTQVGNGDKLRVPIIRPTLENSVILSGYVFRPGSFQFREGLRLSDVLPSFDELRPDADRRYIMIRREVPPEEKVEVISANLERALRARGTAADPQLRPRDHIYVFNLTASRERVVAPVIKELELEATPDQPAQVVKIDGQVKAPGSYPLEPAMHVSDLIRAGGSLDDSAFLGQAELTRYAVSGGEVREIKTIPIDLAGIRHGDAAADVALEPYDLLVIKLVPQWQEPGSIILSGEVRFPGKYPIHHGETLSSVVRRAGGFTDLAFGDGAVFIREELKRREQEQIEMLTNRLQSDLTALSLEALSSSAATANGSAAAGAQQGLLVGQQLLAQLRDSKPVGRLVIDLNRIMKGAPGGPGDVILRDGDKLLVPKRSQEITILGEVQSPTSHVYSAGLTRDDYIARSGGVTRNADKKHIYVVRANGDVVTGNRDGWFRRSQAVVIYPGDTIVVPLDTERIPSLPLWQAVTTIIYNLAVGLLAVRNA